MPRRCTVCTLPPKQRAKLDRDLVRGLQPMRVIASRYGVTFSAVQRHSEEHVPARLLLAQQAREIAEADAILAELTSVKVEVEELRDKALEDEDIHAAFKGIAASLKALELQAKVAQLIKDQPSVNVTLVNTPEWVAVRTTIIEALTPYPDAKGAVVEALLAADAGHD